MRFRKVISVFLAIILVLGLMPMSINGNQAKAESNEASVSKPATIRPQEIKIWTSTVGQWRPGVDKNDDINRSSVALASRVRGYLINPLASDKAKIQALSLMNSKAKNRSSVGSEGFKLYAFDNWQYLDSMIFWDGVIPTPDVIDAAHRNGVPMYGTLFFNWSTSPEDNRIVREFLEKRPDGTFPKAEKIVEIAKYYGFDGYFINQETTGQLYGMGETMRDFMLYVKEYSEKLDYPIRLSWYDAMANDGNRHHYNAVTSGNDYFVKTDSNNRIPANEFFMNFNWGKMNIRNSASHMKSVGRSPYDAYAGFELQQNSINTNISWDYLVGEDRKLQTSIGLFTPDSILGFSNSGEDYHVKENNFWVGYEGDPSISTDREGWVGMSRFVGDSTPLTSVPFKTNFNLGHGKKWFDQGNLSREYEWNARGVSEVLPTWRWWIKTDSSNKLTASYDFENAYLGGSSIKLSGNLDNTSQEVMLYSAKLPISSNTKIKVITQGGQDANIELGISTEEDYGVDSFKYYPIDNTSSFWTEKEIDLGSLSGKEIRAISLKINGQVNDFVFNLGQLSVYDDSSKVANPTNIEIIDQVVFTSKTAEAKISFDKVENADYYIAYAKVGNDWKYLQASSSNIMYLPNIERTEENQGKTQEIKIVSVGKNSSISEGGIINLDWKMNPSDTDELPPEGENIVLGAKVTGKSGEENAERAENALSGTVTGNSDKWCVGGAYSGWMSIRLTEERTVKRWRIEHAGFGGESVNDGLMNTRDFRLQYKDDAGYWQTADTVTGNREHVTDLNLKTPVKAREWKLVIDASHNGSPWGAIRIYNWKMYEEELDDKSSKVVPISQVSVENTSGDNYLIKFRNVLPNTKVEIYKDRDFNDLIAEKTRSNSNADIIFENVSLEGFEGLVYYRTKTIDKEYSPKLAVPYEKTNQTIKSVKLNTSLNRLKYIIGEELDKDGASLLITYESGKENIVKFTDSLVKISGYDSETRGEKELTISYNGVELVEKIRVSIISEDEDTASELSFKKNPKLDYQIGDQLNLNDGELLVKFESGRELIVKLTDLSVNITGFNSDSSGEKILTVAYKNKTISLSVFVSIGEVFNYQKLEQAINNAKTVKETSKYKKASTNLKESFDRIIEEAESLVNNANRQADIDSKTREVLEAIKKLDGGKVDLLSRATSKNYPLAIASWTNDKFVSSESNDNINHINDGIFDFSGEKNNRWTNWKSVKRSEDWVGILFGSDEVEKKKVSSVQVGFFQDHGVSTPASYIIQYYVGETPLKPNKPSHINQERDNILSSDENWESVKITKRESLQLNKMNTIEFEEVETSAIRIKMIPSRGMGLAVTEFEVYGFSVEKPDELEDELPQEPVLPELSDELKIVSIDAGRKYFSKESIKAILDKMEERGFNQLHLLLGNDGLRFVLDDMSLIYGDNSFASQNVKDAIKNGNEKYASSYNVEEDASSVLTEDEMNEIIEYANSKNIEIIPAINSPGHMDTILNAAETLGIADPRVLYDNKKSKTTVDIDNEEAIEFTKELIKKYVKYFSEKGIKIFNLGADEYSNDNGAGWNYLIKNKKYIKFAKYINDLADIILKHKMIPMGFSDGIYYNNTTSYEFNNNIIIALWTNGWSGFNVAKASKFIEKGHKILNVNDSWYYVLGNEVTSDGIYSRQDALKNMANPSKKFEDSVAGKINTIGSMISLWCDNPSKTYEPKKAFEWIDAFADNNLSYFKEKQKYKYEVKTSTPKEKEEILRKLELENKETKDIKAVFLEISSDNKVDENSTVNIVIDAEKYIGENFSLDKKVYVYHVGEEIEKIEQVIVNKDDKTISFAYNNLSSFILTNIELKDIKPEPETPNPNPNPTPPPKPNKPSKPDVEKKVVERLAGENRYETALEVSKKYFSGADTVILARADIYPDALSASILSKVKNAPILLTPSDKLLEIVEKEIERLGAKNVIIVGGERAISKDVEKALKTYRLERLAGQDRFETSALIARKLAGENDIRKSAIIASGEVWADALAAGSFAGKETHPILLVKKDLIPESISQAIKDLKIEKTYVVGGSRRIGGKVKAQLPSIVKEFAGENRFETAGLLAEYGFMESKKVFLVSGESFVDSLIIGGLAGKEQAPILLTGKKTLARETQKYMDSSKIEKISIIGGLDSIGEFLLDQ